ncbi:gag-pol polyprotein, partial [Tanacetum coccineum]
LQDKTDGSIEIYKAQLVANGYCLKYDIDYEETFDPVAKMTIVETLISVVFSYQCNISQMDIKNAFLNGDLNEEVYMAPPPGVPRQLGEVLAFSCQCNISQIDVKNAFSNGDLNEEVYMTPPPNVPLQLGKVLLSSDNACSIGIES